MVAHNRLKDEYKIVIKKHDELHKRLLDTTDIISSVQSEKFGDVGNLKILELEKSLFAECKLTTELKAQLTEKSF
jgi:hypothetical protein